MPVTVYFNAQHSGFRVDHVRRDDQKSHVFKPHIHDIYELLFVRRGNITYLSEGKNYEIQNDTLILIPPARIHQIRVDGSIPYDRYDLLLDLRTLFPKLQRDLPTDIDVISFQNNTMAIDLFRKLDYYYPRVSTDGFCRLTHLLMEELLYQILLITPKQNNTQIITNNPLLRQAISYIETHITRQFSIEDICRELFVSRSHLHHLFNRHMQITPKQYILSKRLTLAQIDIRAGQKPTEVFSQYGFNNYSTFYRAYHQQFGYSPSLESKHTPMPEILA